eukprot:594778-Pleurochrysis_carterae.AAC.1
MEMGDGYKYHLIIRAQRVSTIVPTLPRDSKDQSAHTQRALKEGQQIGGKWARLGSRATTTSELYRRKRVCSAWRK